jgi:DnaJ-class molecular chaperone
VVTLRYTERELNPASGSPHVINYSTETRQQTCKACGPLGKLTEDASAHAAVTGQCPWCLGRGGDKYTHPSLPPGWTCTYCHGDGHRKDGIPLPRGVQQRLATQEKLVVIPPASSPAQTAGEPAQRPGPHNR